MKKNKKIFICLIIIVIIVITLGPFINHSNKKTVSKINTTCEIASFTLGDNGTEIEVKITNDTNKNLKLDNLNVDLYNTSNKKIKSLNKKVTKELKVGNSISLKINSTEQYPETNTIECTVYKKG